MVKRSASSSVSPPPSSQVPETPRKIEKPSTTTPQSANPSPVKSEIGAQAVPNAVSGGWTGEKKAALLDQLISVGLASSNADHLAAQFGVSKEQLRNLISKGKKNFRQKVLAWASALMHMEEVYIEDTTDLVKVERSASSSPCPSPDLKPTTPTKKPKTTPKSSPTKSENGSRPTPGQWTGEKKAALIEHLLAAGLAATKAEDLAKSLDLKKEQITDMTKKGKNNLRSKVVAYAQTL